MNDFRKGIAAAATGAVESSAPGTAVRRYRFGEDFAGFTGHFPGNPVLPAVAQLGAVVSLAQEAAGKRLRLAEIRSAKFLAPVLPGTELLVSCRAGAGPGGELLEASISAGGKTVSSFLLDLAEEREDR